MDAREIISLNFNEIRRRSMKLWLGIPEDRCHWKPDAGAMTCIEMVRHVLESQYIYQQIIKNRGDKNNGPTPWHDQPYVSIQQEIWFSLPYQSAFMQMVNSFSDNELEEIEIIRPALNQRRKLGDYLLRVAYHEAVHAGQLLSYLRNLDIDRPKIWD
ncbi:DinB family protein [Mucilaginibacter pocheonensis]|nr:DinB family protein [Mucilaginibacter pocheonensis]